MDRRKTKSRTTRKRGNIDEEKTARILLDEFKNGIIGKITIETPKIEK